MPSSPPSQFGDAAIKLGYVSDEQLRSGLDEQERMRSEGLRPRPIGALLAHRGLLRPEQIAAVMRHLAGGTLPLSEDGIRLATQVKVLHAAAGNVIGITGTVAEDVARTTVELAVGLGVMDEGQVLALDGNVRQPGLHQLLQAPAAPGWLDVLKRPDDGIAPVVSEVPALSLLPAGGPSDDAVSLCMSRDAADRIVRFRESHRFVLVNLGPITRDPEAAVTASRCDGVIVVLRAGLSDKGELNDIQRMLGGLRVPMTGVVLSRPARRRERSRS